MIEADEHNQAMIQRRPELVHGLRNLVQNAVDFAATTVWVEADTTDTAIMIRIVDDGAGYPPHLLGRIGDPFIRRRRTARTRRDRNTKAWVWGFSSPRPCWNARVPN